MANGIGRYRTLFEMLTAIGIALGALSAGYTISSGQWESNLKWLESRNTVLEDEIETANASITDLKIQLSQSLFGNTDSKSPGISVDVEDLKRSAETLEQAVETSGTEPIEVRVSAGSSVSLFDGGLFVSVVAIEFGGKPLRHRVIGLVSSPGKEGSEIDRKDVGYSVIHGDYDVRILSAGTLSAEFFVRKME